MDRKAMYKMINSKKAVMIGCGFVGSASVFALMQSGLFTEIVLIDACLLYTSDAADDRFLV